MTVSRSAEICNVKGLHARASNKFVRAAADFNAEISVSVKGETVNGNSILDLMMLAAQKGDQIEITATGEEAEAAVEALCRLVAERFGEGE